MGKRISKNIRYNNLRIEIMEMLRYFEATLGFATTWNSYNVFHDNPKRALSILLQYTFDGELKLTDRNKLDITHLVQVKGLTPFQATATECWVSAKATWDYGDGCSKMFVCKCKCNNEHDCVCEEKALIRTCRKLKRNTDRVYHSELTNLLVVLHNRKKGIPYIPTDITDWPTYHHKLFVSPKPRTTLFDLAADVVVSTFDRKDVKGVIPSSMINTIFSL